MKKTVYIVKYKYYQYNSGQADNGTYWAKKEFEDIEKAKQLYQKIKSSIDKKLSEEEDKELIYDYIDNGGYFQEVKVFKSIVEEYDFDMKEIDNNDFSNCPECYSRQEGDSEGCTVCSQLGQRVVNAQSIELAVSAKDWLNRQVMILWEKYNRIFNLDYSLSHWNFYADDIYIVAGYSCRGSNIDESFDLKKEWLYHPNIDQILLDLRSEQLKEKEEQKNKENSQKLEKLKQEISKLENKTQN